MQLPFLSSAKRVARRRFERWLRARGLQLVREPSLTDFLRSRRIEVVLDVGANIGQFGHSLRRRGYAGKIISFEPLSAAFQRLSDAAARDPRWEARPYGLGEHAGSAIIHVSRNTVFASINRQRDAAVRSFSGAEVIEDEEIKIECLDDIFDEFAPRRVFLKIDTQGYEAAVIAGASKSLRSCLGVQMELPILQLYEDNWNIEDAIALMRGHGFVPAQVRMVNPLVDDPCAALEFDVLFRREQD